MQTQKGVRKMNRIEFGEALCRNVLLKLGEGYETELSMVKKNNGVMKTVLYIRKENSECIPCFYMDELYGSYCQGENETGLAEYLAEIVLNECEEVRQQAKEYLKESWIVDRLFIRLIHFKENEESLQDAVYVKYLDLAAVFYVLTEDNEDGVKSYRLPKYIWESLDLGSAETYFERVLENTRRLFPEKLWCVEQALVECSIQAESLHTFVTEQREELVSRKLYVLSNHRKINGAGVILYPNLLRTLGEKFSGDFYIIPSSVHEVILLKETGEEDVTYLNRMICEVNEKQVAPEEVLVNHVYRYSVTEETIQSLTE